MTLQRKTPLKRTGFKKPNDKPKKAARDKPRRDRVEFSYSVRNKMTARYGKCCAMCKKPVEEFHHRKLRSQGGLGTEANCLPLCSRHHKMIHNNVAWSYRHGLLVKSTDNPESVEVFPDCSLKCDMQHV